MKKRRRLYQSRYMSVTNTKAYATLVTKHIFGYVLLYFFSVFN